jgi:hypothetical protein
MNEINVEQLATIMEQMAGEARSYEAEQKAKADAEAAAKDAATVTEATPVEEPAPTA